MAHLYQRGRVWWVAYYVDGKLQRESLATRDEGQAKRLAAKKELDVENGTAKRRARVVTLDRFEEEYREAYLAKHGNELRPSRERSWRADYSALRSVLDFLDRERVTKLSAVRVKHVEAFKVHRMKQVSAASVNKAVRVARAAWSWAVRAELVHENPWKKTTAIQVPEKDIEVLTAEQRQEFMSLVRSRAEPIALLALTAAMTGLRRSEAIFLRWEDVDLEDGWIRVQSHPEFGHVTKSRKNRTVPVPPVLLELLREAHEAAGGEGFCFPSPRAENGRQRPVGESADVNRPWSRSGASRAITRLSEHLGFRVGLQILRRTVTTLMLDSGVAPIKVRDHLGHASLKTTDRNYAGRVGTVHRDVECLGFRLDPEAA